MNKPPNSIASTSDIRLRAEAALRGNADQLPETLGELSNEEIQVLLYELRVHQIQMEMQNEELREAQVRLEESQARYFELYDLAPVGYCTVDQHGLVQESNLAAATLLGVTRGKLVGNPFHRAIHEEGAGNFYLLCKRLVETAEPQECDLRMLRHGGMPFWAHLRTTIAHNEAGSPLIRIVITDINERKMAEAALKESEASVRNILDSAPVLVWQAGTDALCNFFNEPWLDFTGRTMEQEMGNGWTEGVHPDDYQRCLDIYLGAFGARRTFQMEYRLRRADGEYRWVLDNGVPRFTQDSVFAGYVGTCLDITERKEAEEGRQKATTELREASLYSRNLLETSLDPLVTISPEGRITDVNTATERVTGLGREMLIGSDFAVYFTDSDMARAGYKKVFSDGQVIDYHLAIRHASGAITDVLFNASVYRNEDGEVLGVFAAARDITERKKVEEEFRKVSGKFKSLIDSSMDIIAMMDAEHRYVLFNSALHEEFKRIFGWDLKIGDSIIEFLATHPNDLADALKHWDRALEGEDFTITQEFGDVKLERNWYEFHFSPVRDNEGKVVAALHIVRNITERKQMEEALERKTAEMECFTYTVSHDLKSPLVTIKTFLRYLEKDLSAQKAERVAKDLGFIRGAADKMGELLKELLKLARVGYNANVFVQVPLQQVVQEATDLVAGQIAERGVQVQVTQAPVWLTGDKARLVEVFQNLIDNAVKFLGDQPAPLVEIGVEVSADEIVIFVRDNGKGIALAYQPKVFALFHQIDDCAPGSGLGLALVRRIVELHGGKIWVESEGPGHGTTFRITLAKTQLRQQTSALT